MTGNEITLADCEPKMMAGREIKIDETRSVWVRSDAPNGELWAVFTNAGKITRLRLTKEAAQALLDLLVCEWMTGGVSA